MASEDNTESITAKAVAMCVLFAASMTLGCLPLLLSRLFKWDSNPKKNIFVQLLLCFGGGVLLCTTFLHLLPEVSERINKLEYVPEFEIHYAELLMCTGFFTMYFVEECVHFYLHHRRRYQQAGLMKKKGSIQLENVSSTTKSVSTSSECGSSNGKKKLSDDKTRLHEDHAHFQDDDCDDSTIKVLRGLLVVLALSVHELFEGLAIGLEVASRNVWYMFGAVSAHKLVIAFCIGIELITSGMRQSLVIIYAFTFAIVSPLGIGIGIVVSQKGEASTKVPSVILQGLASGTLLYVVFFEILRTERKGGLRQFAAVFSGFFIMLMLTLIE